MRSFLFPILSIIAAVGLYFFFISPQQEAIASLLEKETTFQKSLDDIREIEDTIEKLRSTYASISKTDLEKLERFLPRQFDRVRTTRDLYNIMERSGVEISSLTLNEASKSPVVGESDFVLVEHEASIDFRTDYETFKEVLRDVESSLQIARVDSIKLTAPSGTKDDLDEFGYSSYQIHLTFYSFSDFVE